MPLRLLDLQENDPEQRGYRHGHELAGHVARNAETCYRRCENGGLTRADARRQAMFWDAIVRELRADCHAEMQAIARGADIDPIDVALINCRFEIVFPLTARRALAARTARAAAPPGADADGCTSFGLLPEACPDGHIRIGQTIDGIAAIAGNFAVLRAARSAAVTTLGLHEAGSVAPSVGLNTHGIGVVYNALVTPECTEPAPGLPFRLRTLGVLEATTFAQAIQVATTPPRTTATYLMLAHADGEVLGLELDRERVACLYPEDGVVTHANHFERLHPVQSLYERLLPESLFRGQRMRRLLTARRGPVTEDALAAALRDHFSYPASICLHGDDQATLDRRAMTLASVMIDLSAGVMAVTDGPPCSAPFERFTVVPPPAPP
jgi:isopenicillin-N N-acyltransferase like protein